jgi:1-deoxy-D-xylulose-5-phosphate reductoisomerase
MRSSSRCRSRLRALAAAAGVAKILLTASGGPFLTRAVETLEAVTPDEACKHPNWSMGRKISVDSATMMNKGLEVIEAHWLFGAPAALIEVVIHPQSVIHSMVSYVDGSVLAQLGNPDMRTPIAHALAFPERIESGVAQLDLTTMARCSSKSPISRASPAWRWPSTRCAPAAPRRRC